MYVATNETLYPILDTVPLVAAATSRTSEGIQKCTAQRPESQTQAYRLIDMDPSSYAAGL